MKRMKNLLALVMAVVMVLALAIPAFAANGGTIKVANDNGYTYSVYKVFNATLTDGEYTYSTDNAALIEAIQRPVSATLSDSGFPDIIIDANGKVTKTDSFSASEFAKWLAANKAKLGTAIVDEKHQNAADGYANGFPVTADGYYFITYNNGEPFALTTVDSGKTVQIQNKHDTPFDKDVYKADADRTAADPSHDEQSVQMGDTLYYQIVGKVPATGTNTQYHYLVWDKLSKGQALDVSDSGTVVAGGTVQVYLSPLDAKGAATSTRIPITSRFTFDTLNDTPVSSTPKDTIWVNTTTVPDADTVVYTDTKPSFVVNVDMYELNQYIADPANATTFTGTNGYAIIFEYTATVLEDVGVIDNTAHLVSNDLVKDAQTQNYVSEIVIDKFETGNALQKLQGAIFTLQDSTGKYYTRQDNDVDFLSVAEILDAVNGIWGTATQTVDQENEDGDPIATIADLLYYKEQWDAVTPADPGMEPDPADATAHATWEANTLLKNRQDATKALLESVFAVTDTEGAAHFTGLKDGTYSLTEIKAPDGYVRLETPVNVVVNGKAALDPNNVVDNNPTATAANQAVQLQNVSHVANTPGSVLPSTGGRGTTMLYMAGLGMMLAAGAFLIFRRRAEAGK